MKVSTPKTPLSALAPKLKSILHRRAFTPRMRLDALRARVWLMGVNEVLDCSSLLNPSQKWEECVDLTAMFHEVPNLAMQNRQGKEALIYVLSQGRWNPYDNTVPLSMETYADAAMYMGLSPTPHHYAPPVDTTGPPEESPDTETPQNDIESPDTETPADVLDTETPADVLDTETPAGSECYSYRYQLEPEEQLQYNQQPEEQLQYRYNQQPEEQNEQPEEQNHQREEGEWSDDDASIGSWTTTDYDSDDGTTGDAAYADCLDHATFVKVENV